MASFRLIVLAFVRGYIGRWGGSPSYGEIAAGTGSNRTRVRDAVRSLARDGLLIKAPGPRGLILPEARDDAVARLRALGWTVDADNARITNLPLLPPPELDYPPANGNGRSGGDGEADEAA